ncbi:MAG: alpha/beta hydrolase, partial [Planctomycetia bacterium]
GGHRKKDIHIDQYVADTAWIAQYLRKRFNKEKIFILAESWGSVIASTVVARHPNRFYAYMSVGQVSNVKAYMNEMYDYCIERARQKGDQDALKKLENPGRPTDDMSSKSLFKSLQTAGDIMDRYLAEETGLETGAGFFFKSLWEAPEYSLLDFQATLSGFMFTQRKIIKELMRVDMNATVPKLKVPTFYVMGKHDLWRNESRRYFDKLEAPSKQWFLIEDAGHMARGDRPEQVLDILIKQLLPLAR